MRYINLYYITLHYITSLLDNAFCRHRINRLNESVIHGRSCKRNHCVTLNFQWKLSVYCRVYTRTHVARKHVPRTSNMYPDTGIYMSTDTCRRIQVARSGYLLTISRQHNYCSFMSRSTCIPLCIQAPATDGRQTGDNVCRRYKIHVDGDKCSLYKWIQLVSWCKRGL